jgi:hypothetical protein
MKKTIAFILGLIFAFATVAIAADKVVATPAPAPKVATVDNTVKKPDTKKAKKPKKDKKPAPKPVTDNTVKPVKK